MHQVHAIDFPTDFPATVYLRLEETFATKMASDDQRFHFVGGWKGTAYRFLSAVEAGDSFNVCRQAESHPGGVSVYRNRFDQEQSLFAFFVNSLSVIECLFYALHWIGNRANANLFSGSITQKDLKRINVDNTITAFRKLVNQPPTLLSSFLRLKELDISTNTWRDTSEYAGLKSVRNVLAHRASYGRILHASVGTSSSQSDIWRLNDIPLDDTLISTRRKWLVQTLSELLDGSLDFAASIT
jgi:hypothetical protein